MLRKRLAKSWGVLVFGLTLGLAIGGAMTLGVLLEQRAQSGAALPGFDDLQLKAMASHGGDNFAIATGPVDDEVEGLFTLDFLTGDLQCFVPNSRGGGMAGWFKVNVANDLKVERGKKPNYLIATGNYTTQASAGNQRPAASLVYIADSNSGEVACYSFLWTKAATAAGVPQASPMTLVGKWQARTVGIRK